jgi:GTP-binding protein
VAIVGRPNVGKSTLFNRLAGRKLAVVEDRPGVTRDRHYADARVGDRPIVLVDTGGFDPRSDDPMMEDVARQVRLALEECDVVLCVLDATSPPTEADRDAVHLLRGANRPVVYVANKADSERAAHEAMWLYELGLPSVVPVSALHGVGRQALEAALLAVLPPPHADAEPPGLEGVPRVAIVGRPNAGKSSLVNRLLGEERQIVDDRPGTTVDAIDALYEREGRRMVLVDTAGMRRKAHVDDPVEASAVLQAVRAMERSDVVVLLVDARTGVAEQDAKILGLAEGRGRGVVIALNKCDGLDEREQHRAEQKARDVLSFVPWAPVVRLSARTGRGVRSLLETIDRVLDSFRRRVTTGELNRFFETVLERHPPPVARGRPVRLYYVTQASVAPPTFVAVTNHPDAVHFSYQRYVANQLREAFGFEGVPVRVLFREKRKRDARPGSE